MLEELEVTDDIITSPIFNADGYKPSHYFQFPKGIKQLEAYIESRGGKYPVTPFVGLQIELKKHFLKPITREQIDAAEAVFAIYGAPFFKEGWEYILKEYDGYLPIEIWAPDEGHVIPTNNVLLKVKTFDPKCSWLVFWVVSYIETTLLRGTWFPNTVGSIDHHIKKMFIKFLKETSDTMDVLPSMLHDFGARGASSLETAGIAGCIHSFFFMGSDTITGGLYAMRYYNIRKIKDFPIRTVPAAEHSSITAWRRNRETDAYRNMLRKFGGKYPFIAVVSDSYDIFHAVRDIWGTELKDEVIQCGSMLVVRPDSGNPVEVVMKVLMILDSKYGHTVNSKGYRVLKNVRVIQGDGVNPESIFDILTTMKGYNFSAENVLYGMGGKLHQGHDRDTQKYAMKTCAAEDEDGWYEVYKDPVTDQVKKSKRGRLMLYYGDEVGFFTGLEEDEIKLFEDSGAKPMLKCKFRLGKLLIDHNYKEVQARLDSYLNL